ncbi:MAG: TIGR03668 family PPOX class F420-dependent oxidoreductase, partial [Anaerolineae bacterium]|nr:TIGR03668 family PPOX class F420-dependent oxidoreductase [Anaerolineae bacterium]
MMPDISLSDWERALIITQPVARLATVDEFGQPHVIPIVYVFDQMRFFTPIDGKKKRTPEARRLRRVRNILQNPRVSLIIDVYDADWSQLAWVQVRGTAQLIDDGPTHQKAIDLLRRKYDQYQRVPLGEWPV